MPMTTKMMTLKEAVTTLESAAFQSGKAQSMDMTHRQHFQDIHDEAKSAFLDYLIDIGVPPTNE